MRLTRGMLIAMARQAALEHKRPVVVVAFGDEATSCCGAWHEYAEGERTVCKVCFCEVLVLETGLKAEVSQSAYEESHMVEVAERRVWDPNP